MKFIGFLTCLVLLMGSSPVPLAAAEENAIRWKSGPSKGTSPLGLPNRTKANSNNISSWYDNDGTLENNAATGNSGLTYPRQTATAVFTAGLMWGGFFNDGLSPHIRVNGQSYNSGTQPGAIVGIRTGVAENPDAPDVRIWRVRRDYFTADLILDAAEIFNIPPDQVTEVEIQAVRDQYAADWAEWPAQKGAPFYDSDGDGAYTPEFDNGEPILYPEADEPGLAEAYQVIWYVCNDLRSQPWTNVQSGIEEQTTIWGYDRLDALGEVVFKRFRLIYKGTASTTENASIDNMYVGQWSDPDVGSFSDDFAGCDSSRGLGYAYNGEPVDADYSSFGLSPPAAGYDMLQGPVVLTGNPLDTAVYDFRKMAGATNLPLTSFVHFEAGGLYSDPPFSPDGGIQWYQMLRGLPPTPQGPPDPPPFINPVTNQPTFFWVSGDPVSGTGWIDGILGAPGDRRFMLSSGPFSLALGDTQEIIVSTVLGLGTSYLNSITVLRSNDDFIQEWFNDLVGWSFPTDVKQSDEGLPWPFTLQQNYPNPFNPTTTFEFSIPRSIFANLSVYNILGEKVATVVDEKLPAGIHTANWNATNHPSGVYFYRLQAGEYTETRKLILLR